MVSYSSFSTGLEVVSPNFMHVSSNSTAMNPNSLNFSWISSIIVQNISYMVPTKLNHDNYLVWKALFADTSFTRIVDGFEICLPSFLHGQSGTNTMIPNPEFEIWSEKGSE